MAVLFLIAIYANKKWYSKPPTEPAVAEGIRGQGGGWPSAPPLSLAERYAMMLRVHEMEIQGEMFSEGGKTFLLAKPAIPAGGKESGKQPDRVIPGTLFDVTKLAEGVRPEMLQRQIIYGANQTRPFSWTSSRRWAWTSIWRWSEAGGRGDDGRGQRCSARHRRQGRRGSARLPDQAHELS